MQLNREGNSWSLGKQAGCSAEYNLEQRLSNPPVLCAPQSLQGGPSMLHSGTWGAQGFQAQRPISWREKWQRVQGDGSANGWGNKFSQNTPCSDHWKWSHPSNNRYACFFFPFSIYNNNNDLDIGHFLGLNDCLRLMALNYTSGHQPLPAGH